MTYGGLTYRISQVSLVVRDIDSTMAAYTEAFGWGPWQVYDHVPPNHHDSQVRGERVDFTLRGAECMVGDLNFELLQPLSGPSVWQEFLDTKGEGIASIAVMFDAPAESEACKSAFAAHGIGVVSSARIGEHIEYYYLDTEARFKCMIESGSGHALDFMPPSYVFPPQTPDRAVSGRPRGAAQ
ncbi:VOC family protein [Kribbella solani]|uniref:VOC family protein n=1 Tax=Kribbella solani TaxID=236067 RepID=UPI0029BD8F73|nr:VOC family protein [Kribbella solani]MDX2970135.1 VOC family protein [Kribbella solani]MDX3004234.1 VOC family protein [Kribbella solani]